MWLFLAALVLFLLLPGVLVAQYNLALQASGVQASDEVAGHAAKQTIDGSMHTYWESTGTKVSPAWIEISWKDPITICDLVIQRFYTGRHRPDLTLVKVDVLENGAWHELTQIGDGKANLPPLVYAQVSARSVQKLRITNLDAYVQIREIQVFSKPTPAWMDIRGDARGNIIGVLTDGFGYAGIPANVSASGQTGGRTWKATAKTGKFGSFAIPMPTGLAGAVEFTATANGERIRKVVDASDIHQGLVPSLSDANVELNGVWKFMPDPPQGFQTSDFDDSTWKTISVPSHWVMAGFKAEKDGGYRRHIELPAEWRGQRIRLAFDGVYSAAEVWWNGQRVGSHLGGATPFQLDITTAAKPGDNIIAVRVTSETIASRMDNMSSYADFSLAGIYRRVRVFSVPTLHVHREQSHAEFDTAYQNADLVTEVSISNESVAAVSGAAVQLTLLRDDQTVATGKAVPVTIAPWSRMDQIVRLEVSNPLKWNSEHPSLYTLQTVVSQDGKVVERLSQKIGFRDTRIRNTELLIDGVPVKLMGTAHHDADPVLGRAITPEIERRDLELMKEANIDAVRTSHYPQLPELPEYADELGLYVEAEAPFCWVDEAYDLRWGAITRQLTAELVERDMSHPSVAYWSAGNESDWGPTLDLGAEEMRLHDPSRPVMGSWTDNLDFTIRHNPVSVARIRGMAENAKPVLWDESLAPYQGIWRDGEAMWRDPGIRDYYVAPLIAVMDAYRQSKVVQASFIWAWADDMFLVPGRGSEYGRSFTESHGVDRIYYEKGHGLTGDAPWGIVDGWRRKKPEFWHIKKLYSPIHVTVRNLEVPPAGRLEVPVENRYFFTNLSEISVQWSLGDKQGTVRPDIPPQSSGNIEIALGSAVTPGNRLQLRFMKGEDLIDIESIPLGEASAPAVVSAHQSPLERYDQALLSGISPRFDGDGFSLGISGSRGLLQYFVTNNAVTLYDAPQIHILASREPTELPYKIGWTLDRPVEIDEDAGSVTLVSQGHYSDLVGTYSTVFGPEGDVTVSYDFSYTGRDILTKEIGFQFDVPLQLDHLSWQRNGEWTWYPEEHIGGLTGDVHVHSGRPAFTKPTWPYGEDDSPMGSNIYRSTKRNIIAATVSDADGNGWTIHSDGSQHLRAFVDSDRIRIYVNDWYGGSTADMGEYVENYGDGKILHNGDRIHSILRLSRTPKNPF